MFVINFRVPFLFQGGTIYINGSAISRVSYRAGEFIFVYVEDDNPFIACVIESVKTKRGPETFSWKIRE